MAGPRAPRSSELTPEEEAIAVAFRRHTLLALDDFLYTLQATIPHLTRSSLHLCFQRHSIARLPEVGGDKPAQRKFKAYPIAYFHIDIAEVQTEAGKLYLFVAIDRTSKVAFAELHEKATRRIAAEFLRVLVAAIPYRVHTVLTDNGGQIYESIRHRNGPTAQYSMHLFKRICVANAIEHRLTKPKHPWTNGQVERMNRTLKDATVRRYYYETHDQLRAHLTDLVHAYNFAKRLKALRGLTPYEFVCRSWTKEPSRFKFDQAHRFPGLNT